MSRGELGRSSGGDLRLRLVLTCAAAAAVHLLVLIYCDVTYVPPLLEPLPTSHVYLFSAADSNSAFARHIGLWIELADPSRLIRPRSTLLDAPRPVALQPLPAEREKMDQPVPGSHDPELFPVRPVDPRNALWLPLPPIPPPATAGLQAPVPPESVAEFDEALSRRLPTPWKPPMASVRLLSETGPTIVRLAVDARGVPCAVLLQESCGERRVDESALREIQRLRFSPDPGSLVTWGRVKVFWHFREQEAP
ncbi:energy transducer TonB [Methylacidimicrobium tartarophylax]|uniref:TonB C-terminal domain-containing protein n=1 Tax=Methylacidimicrobium tartarophylax TaxID=1041768 RepID=A0A5E6MH99_9BACT|nr:hypothetical protein [Methylacidimicrobium tartarophylax]VVM07267.1 hypothetical protein MAMT_01636 [Methylacidimicrobium tartarophylax]